MQRNGLVCLMVLLSACSARPFVVKPFAVSGASSGRVFVVSHGWHTGLVLPMKAIGNDIPELKKRFADAEFVEIGWGDKGFYQANGITSNITLRAIFWPTPSVVHVVGIRDSVPHYFAASQVERVCVDAENYPSLRQFVVDSFARTESGQLIAQRQGLYGDSQFYQGVGDYYLLNTCNNWTAKGLKSAGMNISPIFKLTADSVMDFVVAQQQNAVAIRACQ